MNIIIGLPKQCSFSITIGLCPEVDKIYLFGVGVGANDAERWINVLIHENLHNVLHKFKVPTKNGLQEKIINKMLYEE